MRVTLQEPAVAEDLIVYLGRCDCRARRLRSDLIDVDERSLAVGDALSLVRAGRCYSCGEQIPTALAELGSPLCHSCRVDSVPGTHAGLRSSRLKVESLLRVWNALHPLAHATVAETV